MKYALACATLCALFFSAACSQSPERLLATANKYHQNGKYKEASILYQKVIAKDKTNAEAYYREGLNLIDDHQPAQAAGFLRRAVDLRPDNTDAAVKLAEIYLTIYASDQVKYKNLLADVRDLTAKVVAHQPDSFEGYRLQALLALADRDTNKALDFFARANKAKPNAPSLVGWYAQTLLALNRPAEAVALVKSTLAQNKAWGPGYDFLFMQASRSNDSAEAEAVLRDRIANDPASAAGYVNLSNYLLVTNRNSEAEGVIRKVLADKKTFPNGKMLVGDFYARSKKYDQALEQYRAGLAEDPKQSVDYQERIVAVDEVQGKREEALQLAKETVAKNPKDNTANQVYASLLLQSHSAADLNKSVTELKLLVQKNPANAALHLDLSRAYLGLNNPDAALSESLEALRYRPKLVPALVISARIYEDRGQHGKAMEQSEAALATEPGNPEGRLVHARALIGSGNGQKAQAELEMLVQSYPQMNDARLQLAGLYAQNKQFDKATQEFTKVWQANPPDMRGYIGIQTLKLFQGQTEEAIAGMQSMVDKNPNDTTLRFQLANFEATGAGVVQKKGDGKRAKQLTEAAIDNLQAVLKMSPHAEEAWIRLGMLQRQDGQTDAALASFEQATKSNPRSASGYLNLAMLLEATGKRTQAADAYNRVLGIDQQNTLALNNLAFLNAESGTNLDQAMTLATRAQKQVPNSPDVSDTLGYVYYQKNLNSEALQIFRKVVQDYPQNPTFHFHLAMALLKQGDKQGARDEAQKALRIAPPQQQDKIRSFVEQIG